MPRGSNKLLTTDNTPRLVNGFFSWEALKLNVSDLSSQKTPSERCTCFVFSLRSRLQRLVARSLLRKASVTLGSFEAILCSRKFAVASMDWVRLSRSMDSSGPGRDLSPSST